MGSKLVASMFQYFCHGFFVELALFGATTRTPKIVGNISPVSSWTHVAFIFTVFFSVDVITNSTFPFIH